MRSRTNTEGLVLVFRVLFCENTYRGRVFRLNFVNFSKFDENIYFQLFSRVYDFQVFVVIVLSYNNFFDELLAFEQLAICSFTVKTPRISKTRFPCKMHSGPQVIIRHCI